MAVYSMAISTAHSSRFQMEPERLGWWCLTVASYEIVDFIRSALWDRQSRLQFGKRALQALSRERLVCQVVGRQQPRQRVAEQVLVVAVVEPPFELAEVGVQVLRAELV